MTWSPSQYSQFEDDRTRPVRDLVSALASAWSGADPVRAIDLGCGPGNSTEVLAARFPGTSISGIDSSPEMVAAARLRMPSVDFKAGDIATWRAQAPIDVILSNAVLHWLPEHEVLMPRLVEQLTPGGSLAVQMPDNLEEPAYRVMREVAGLPAWRERLEAAGGKRGEMLDAAGYYGLLKPLCRRVDVWRTIYVHVLAGPDAIVEWFKGSGLRPYLEALGNEEPGGERAEFLTRYREGIARAYPALPDGSALLPFPRLFFVATK